MSDTAPTAPSQAHGQDQNKFGIFVTIAMVLAVITGLELVTVYLPWVRWFLFTILVVLSTVKFMFVIFYFMHLRWDRAFCTILFFIGLVLAAGTMWALLQLFGSEVSKPLTAAALEPPAIVLPLV
jgi:cytochrome c oxidase subunit 4